MFKQAVNTARAATPDPLAHVEVIRKLAELVPGFSFEQTPAALSQNVYRLVSEVTGVKDPYAQSKQETNSHALALLPELEELVRASANPLKAAVHLAAAGNIIDLGIGHTFDLKQDIVRMLKQPFAIDDFVPFINELEPGRSLLYLGDNAGEIVFDRVLVEHLLQLKIKVVFCVKSGPIINDATLEDAKASGMTALVPMLETGSNAIGVDWARSSAEFRKAVAQADIIVAKGHGNFETCIGHPGNFFFLLKAKCELVAQELGVRLGDTVFKHVSS